MVRALTQKIKKFDGSLPELMSSAFAWVENRAKTLDTALHADDWSKPRRPVGSHTPSEQHSDWEKASAQTSIRQNYFMLRNFYAAWRSYRYLKTPTQPTHTQISPALLAELEAMAKETGALAVGYTKVTPDMIFSDMAVPHENAIVIVSEMERETMDKAPHAEVLGEVVETYATTTEVANALTRRLRKEGYSAYSGIAIGGAVDHVRLAAKANLGAIGYHGLLISPLSGARLRINVL